MVSDGPSSAGTSLGPACLIYLVALSNRLTVIGTFFLCRPSSQVNSHEGEIKNRRSPYGVCTLSSNQALGEPEVQLGWL